MEHILELLDGRHSGYPRFKYRVMIGGENRKACLQNFNEIRDWCWESWGSSGELVNSWPIHFKDRRTVVWSWRCEPRERSSYIYLKDDEQASFFKLKWL